jgi:predicted nuclease with TOPRIM domain
MNPTIALTILIWTLIVAGLGFVIGQHFGNESNRRRSATQELRDQVSRLGWDAAMLDHQLKKVLDILNDVRTRIPAVSKGLEKPAP